MQPKDPVEDCSGASCSALLVWWLTEEDCHGFEPHQDRNPLRIPDYVWEQFCNRYGRAGRGRLWVPDHITLDSLLVGKNDPRWTPELLLAGGIVIEAKDAEDCAQWGGTITTLTLDLWDAPSDKGQTQPKEQSQPSKT